MYILLSIIDQAKLNLSLNSLNITLNDNEF